MTSVFAALKVILFAFSQKESSFKSFLRVLSYQQNFVYSRYMYHQQNEMKRITQLHRVDH